MSDVTIAIIAVVCLGSVGALAWIHVTAMAAWAAERRDLLDRIQSPDAASYAMRKKVESEASGQVVPFATEAESIFARKPWERDPQYAGYEFFFDHESGYVEVTNDEQELSRMDIDMFLTRYR